MAVTIDERPTIKRLVAASGADEVWYEDIDNMTAGTLIELNTSDGAINTADQLNVFEGFQKVFVVNGEKLYVADFVNTKLTLAEFTTAPTRGSTITQANGTDATMIVDFVNAGKTAIYGYVTAGVFDCTRTISGGGLVSGNSLVPTGINGMLTHTALATAHTDGTEIEQATSGAKMTVEHTDTAKTHTWGRITTGVFDTDHNVTGDGTTFQPTATDISPPVWHAWTVYPTIGETTYGTMPTKAYLGCLYRGRCVLSGNPTYPHQWYMSRIAEPWNWIYASIDPLTAAAGQNADAGEIGDIIRALIPYKDDYLIFGCATSIWVLTGDPAGGGKINEVDLTVGMYGANSWDFDGDGNLYFWGTAGIYKVPLGFRSVENLTEISMPNLIGDEAADPTSYRITITYDRKRHGLLICITKLSDGSNSNYFYDLKLKAFFPESYPDECGAYSLFYYAANDVAYADLLVGCKDGFIRKFDITAKDDNVGDSTDPINSYAVWPIQHLTEDNDKEGKLTSLTIELSGGLATIKLTHAALTTAHAKGDTLTQLTSGATMVVAFSNAAKTQTFGHTTTGTFVTTGGYIVSGNGDGTSFTPTAVGTGTFSDTDGVSYEIHVGDDAETVIEKIKDGVAPHSSGTLSNSGRKARIRTKVRGGYIGIKFFNSEASESWSINKVFGEVKPAGKIR